MSNVVPIDKPLYASCPECGGQEWLITVDNIRDQWCNITGTVCKYCDFRVDWVKAKKETVVHNKPEGGGNGSGTQ